MTVIKCIQKYENCLVMFWPSSFILRLIYADPVVLQLMSLVAAPTLEISL